jgi:transcriptional regulator with XRE-family HTH domain
VEILMAINLGEAARDLRMKLNLSLREAEVELGISYVHLCNIENGKVTPSQKIVERFHDAWGIDLYMFALAFHSDAGATPRALRQPVKALEEGCRRHIEALLRQRAKDGASCLTSAD